MEGKVFMIWTDIQNWGWGFRDLELGAKGCGFQSHMCYSLVVWCWSRSGHPTWWYFLYRRVLVLDDIA